MVCAETVIVPAMSRNAIIKNKIFFIHFSLVRISVLALCRALAPAKENKNCTHRVAPQHTMPPMEQQFSCHPKAFRRKALNHPAPNGVQVLATLF
jgi:hypothetical protein